MRLAVVKDEGATKMFGTALKVVSTTFKTFDLPTPGGATSMAYIFGYSIEPLENVQTFRSITDEIILRAAHRRNISGDWISELYLTKESIQLGRRLPMAGPVVCTTKLSKAVWILGGFN